MLAFAPAAEGVLPRLRLSRRVRKKAEALVACARYLCGEMATGMCKRCETKLCEAHLASHEERCGG